MLRLAVRSNQYLPISRDSWNRKSETVWHVMSKDSLQTLLHFVVGLRRKSATTQRACCRPGHYVTSARGDQNWLIWALVALTAS